MNMKVYELLEQSGVTARNPLPADVQHIEITGISESSLQVTNGHLFVAISGYATDGEAYIGNAIERGASLIVTESDLTARENVPFIQVDNARESLALLASAFYRNPSQDKLVIGITGTNGKTTTALFLQHLLKKAGFEVAYFGTVYNEVNGQRYESKLTTPSATEIQASLARSNDDVVVIETSSQGLHQYRMAGMQFDYALFTNLQHDHLDYHKTMEAYYQAKKSLFSLMKADGKAVINSYTMWGNRLAKELAASGKQVLTVDTKKDATSYVLDKTTDTAVVAFNGQGGQIEAIEAPLSGVYNQENLILATTVMVDLGLDAGNTNDAIADFAGIAGRLEYYPLADGNEMVVDYAHTPDAIEALLTTLNAQYPNHETIHIFGFRGQRDTKKFPQMVSASQTGADLTILTTDDLNGVPRQEMAEKYLEYVTQYGLDSMAMALDRVEAVELALEMSLNPVLLVLTGKGHEAYSEENKYGVQSDQQVAHMFRYRPVSGSVAKF